VHKSQDPDNNNIDEINFGDDNDAGYTMSVNLLRGAGVPTGTLRWVQLTRSMRRKVRKQSAGGGTYTWRTNGWALDNQVPYADDVIFNDVTLINTQEDSPGQGFGTNVQTCSVEDEFKMYVMWKSSKADSIWITLGIFQWSWEGQVTLNPSGQYILVAPATRYSNQNLAGKMDPTRITGNDLPTWNGVCPGDMALTVTAFQSAAPASGMLGDPPPQLLPVKRGPRKIRPRFQTPDSEWLAVFLNPFNHGFMFTQEDAERQLGRKFGPTVQYPANANLRNFIWATRENATWVGLGFLQPVPIELKLQGLDLNPYPQARDTVVYFRADVAPFCYGDAAYWSQFAHAPLHVGTISETRDASLNQFVAQLQTVVGSAVRLTTREGWAVNMRFSDMPSMDLMRRIAALPQCHSVRRWQADPTDPDVGPDNQ
jgi:hypothetical protein